MMPRFFPALLAALVLLWPGPSGFAQTQPADSLYHVIDTAGSDEVRADVLNQLSFQLLGRDLDSARVLNLRARKLSQEIDYALGLGRAHNVSAIIHYYTGNSDSARVYFEAFLTAAREAEHIGYQAQALNNLGLWHQNHADFAKAMTYYLESLRIDEERDNQLGIATSCNNIGLIFEQQNEIEKSLEYHRRAFRIRKREGFQDDLCDSYNNIGLCFQSIEQYDSADFYFQAGLKLALDIQALRSAAQLASNLASKERLTGNYDASIRYNLQALRLNPAGMAANAAVYNDLSNAYLWKDQADSALHYVRLALGAARISEDTYRLPEIYGEYVNIFEHVNNADSMGHYLRLMLEIKDSIYDLETTSTTLDLEAKYETEKNSRIVAEQERDLAQKDLDLERGQAQIGWLAGGLAAVLLGGLLIFTRIRSRQKQALQEVRITEQQKGLDQLFVAVEDERKRIAKDLHDGVGQQLSLIKMGFRKLQGNEDQPESAPQPVRELEELIDQTARDARSISHQMMPQALTELGLIPAIEDLTGKISAQTELTIELEHFNLKNRYEERIEIAVYRICQELLNNVIKHAGAGTATVQLFQNKEQLILIVEDDGRGMDHRSNDGHGLLNIKNRLSAFNGKVNLDASPSSGTTATITIPV